MKEGDALSAGFSAGVNFKSGSDTLSDELAKFYTQGRLAVK